MSRATGQPELRAVDPRSPTRRPPPASEPPPPGRAPLSPGWKPLRVVRVSAPPCCLLAAFDDVTWAVLAALFRTQEIAAAYLELLRTLCFVVGLPAAVYHGQPRYLHDDAHWTVYEQFQGF